MAPGEIDTRWRLSWAAPGVAFLVVEERTADPRGVCVPFTNRRDALAQLPELREELKHRITVSTVPPMTFDPVECDG